jgi:hypothetical protein
LITASSRKSGSIISSGSRDRAGGIGGGSGAAGVVGPFECAQPAGL